MMWFYDIMFSRRIKLFKKKRILAIYKYDRFMRDYYDWYFMEMEKRLNADWDISESQTLKNNKK